MSEPEWDARKHERNLRRGRVGFVEASAALEDPDRIEWPDRGHSDLEDRFITVGMTRTGRLILIVTTMDELGSIRIISARRPTRRERYAYETRNPFD